MREWEHGDVAVRAVFVVEGNDLSVHTSVAAAENSTEVYDIRHLAFFADDGTVFTAHADGYRVRLTATGERRSDELRALLRSYLASSKGGLDPALADEPASAAQAILDRRWIERRFKWFPWLDRRFNGSEPPRVPDT